MIRGTTPTLVFETDTDCTMFDIVEIAMAQNNKVVITKTLADCIVEGTVIKVKLTEEETLLLKPTALQMQIRAGIGTERIASNVVSTAVETILKEGSLQ